MQNINRYCWFDTIEELIEDHKKIKEQIKEREIKLDMLSDNEDCNRYISEVLEEMSHEMMSINL